MFVCTAAVHMISVHESKHYQDVYPTLFMQMKPESSSVHVCGLHFIISLFQPFSLPKRVWPVTYFHANLFTSRLETKHKGLSNKQLGFLYRWVRDCLVYLSHQVAQLVLFRSDKPKQAHLT